MNKRRSRNGSDEYTVGKNRPPVQTRFKPVIAEIPRADQRE
jgi:hypothetical protein